MTMAVANVHPGALFASPGCAVSREADGLIDRLNEARAQRTSAVAGRGEKARERLLRALQEAADDHAYALAEAPGRALAFMQSLPADIPLPEVVVESDGEIGLDWDRGRRRVISVSVGEGPMLRFAALIGPEPVHGRVAYAGVLPQTLGFFLQRVHAD